MFGLIRGLTDAVATIVTAPVKILDRETGREVEKATKTILRTPTDAAEKLKRAALMEDGCID